MSDNTDWGRRVEDHGVMKVSVHKVERAERTMRLAVYALLILVTLVAIGALWIGWHTSQRMEQLINETQLSAQRNTELLAVECDLETGKPKPLPSEQPFRNTDDFLEAFCGRQVRQANVISGYLTTINTAAKEQLTVHEENMLKEHQRLEALIQQRRAPAAVRKPIPVDGRRAPGAGTTTTTPPAPAAPTTTTTTCVKNKAGKCR